MPEPPITVVVATRDRPALLDRCLAALREALGGGDELVVVDSASDDAHAVATVAGHHAAAVVRAPAPGASLARNIGWRAASNDVVAFVDDDVVVSSGWADAIRGALDTHVDFVTGRVGVPPEHAGRAAPVAIKDDDDRLALDGDPSVYPGGSGNLAVRRAALEAIGGFDERMGPGRRIPSAEDADLFDRLFAAGFRGVYEPAAAAVHVQWRGRGDRLRVDWRYGIGAGARLSKVARADRARARVVARVLLWDAGLRSVPGDLRSGYEFGVASALVRVGGVAVGAAAGACVGVRDGHFTPLRSRWRTGARRPSGDAPSGCDERRVR